VSIEIKIIGRISSSLTDLASTLVRRMKVRPRPEGTAIIDVSRSSVKTSVGAKNKFISREPLRALPEQRNPPSRHHPYF
jgi:hypothetical protein